MDKKNKGEKNNNMEEVLNKLVEVLGNSSKDGSEQDSVTTKEVLDGILNAIKGVPVEELLKELKDNAIPVVDSVMKAIANAAMDVAEINDKFFEITDLVPDMPNKEAIVNTLCELMSKMSVNDVNRYMSNTKEACKTSKPTVASVLLSLEDEFGVDMIAIRELPTDHASYLIGKVFNIVKGDDNPKVQEDERVEISGYYLNGMSVEEANKALQKKVSSGNYQKYLYKNEKFSVIAPKNVEELFLDGNENHYAILPYFTHDRMHLKNEGAGIYLVRKNDEIDKPYVGIMVDGDKLTLAVTKHNAFPEGEDIKIFLKEFMSKYSLKNELMYGHKRFLE